MRDKADELQSRLRQTERELVREQQKSKELAEKDMLARRQLEEELKRKTDEERAAYLAEREQMERQMAEERKEAELKLTEETALRSEIERNRDAEVKRRTAQNNLMRKMESASYAFKEEALLERKKEAAEEKTEKVRDVVEYDELMGQRRALMVKAHELMSHLNLPASVRDDFEEKHHRALPALDTVSDDPTRDKMIRSLKVDLEEFGRALERLELRTETDGVFLALRNLMSANVWKPKQLAQMIVKGPGALKVEGLSDSELDYTQFEHFLQRKEIKTTKSSIVFFLQKVGSTAKKVESGKTRIEVDKFVKAFETVLTPPVQV